MTGIAVFVTIVSFSIGIIIGYFMSKHFREKAGTLIIKDGFAEGVIENITIRFNIPEDVIYNSSLLSFKVEHKK